MSRKLSIPAEPVLVRIPLDIRAKMSLKLYSELEGRVPYGEQSAFIVQLIRDHFESERLDLGAFGFPEGYFVTGPKAMIERLKQELLRQVEKELTV